MSRNGLLQRCSSRRAVEERVYPGGQEDLSRLDCHAEAVELVDFTEGLVLKGLIADGFVSEGLFTEGPVLVCFCNT